MHILLLKISVYWYFYMTKCKLKKTFEKLIALREVKNDQKMVRLDLSTFWNTSNSRDFLDDVECGNKNKDV